MRNPEGWLQGIIQDEIRGFLNVRAELTAYNGDGYLVAMPIPEPGRANRRGPEIRVRAAQEILDRLATITERVSHYEGNVRRILKARLPAYQQEGLPQAPFIIEFGDEVFDA